MVSLPLSSGATNGYRYHIDNIAFRGTYQPSAALDALMPPLLAKDTLTLADIARLTAQIQELYPNATVTVPLSEMTGSTLPITIDDPTYQQQTARITRIALTGITLPQSVLIPLISPFEGRPYRTTDMRNLRRQLREQLPAGSTISLPEHHNGTVTFTVTTATPAPAPSIPVQPAAPAALTQLLKSATAALDSARPRYQKNIQPRPANPNLSEKSRGIYLFNAITPPQKAALPVKTAKTPVTESAALTVSDKTEKPAIPRPTAPRPQASTTPRTTPDIAPDDISFATIFADDIANQSAAVYTEISNGLTWIERPEDELYLVDLVGRDGVRISNQLDIYQDNTTGDLKIPLGALASALAFQVAVDVNTGTATGFFKNESNTFEVNIPARTLTIAGDSLPFPDDAIEVSPDDIFVSNDTLAAWFDITLSYAFEQQRLFVDSNTVLPYQAFLRRRNIWDELTERRQRQQSATDPDTPRHTLADRWLSPPAMRVNVSNNSMRSAGESEITSTQTANVQAQGDFLMMQGTLTAALNRSDDKTELNALRLNLRKTDPNQGMPLGASQFEIGDITAPTQPLINANNQGRGAFYSNQPINAVRDPDNFTIIGNAPVGWDVEVYQDTQLLDFLTVGDSGEFTFSTLPLNTGLNVFRVVQYGPNGEQKEYTEQFYLGPGIIESGKLYYDVAALQSDEPLIPHGSANYEGDSSLSTRFEYGINRQLSLSGGLFSGLVDGETNQAATLGARATVEQIFNQLDFSYQADDAYSYRMTSRRAIGRDSDITIGWQENVGFNPDDRDQRTELFAAVATAWQTAWLPLSFRLSTTQETFYDQQTTETYDFRVATSLRNWSVTNNLSLVRRELAQHDTITGDLTLRRRFRGGDIRSRVAYNTGHDAGIKTIDLRGNYHLGDDLALQKSITQSFTDGDFETTQFDSRLSWQLGNIDLGLNMGATNHGQYTVGLNLTSYLMPTTDGYRFYDKGTNLSDGRVAIQAFIDHDGDLSYTPDTDILLPEVTFRHTGYNIQAVTDANGVALLGRLRPYQANTIEIDQSTLTDIYLKPVFNRMNIFAKPGQTGMLAYPLQYRGEIDGLIFTLDQNGDLIERPDAALALVNEHDTVIQTTLSSFDGYFTLTDIPLGLYRIKNLDSNDMIMDYHTGDMAMIYLTRDEPFQSIDLILTTQKAE